MWRGWYSRDVVSLLCHNGERCLLRVAVGLACLDDVGALAQLGLPEAVTHVLTLKPDVGLVFHRDVHIAEVVAHVALLHVDHLVLLRVVLSGYPYLYLTLVAVFLGLNLVLTEVQVLV